MILFFLLLMLGGNILGAARGGSSFPTHGVKEEEPTQETGVWRENPLIHVLEAKKTRYRRVGSSKSDDSMATLVTWALPLSCSSAIEEEDDAISVHSDSSVDGVGRVSSLSLHPQRRSVVKLSSKRVSVIGGGGFSDPKDVLWRKKKLEIENAIIADRSSGIVSQVFAVPK